MADNKNKPQGYTPEDIENSKEFLSNLTKINKELKENKKNNKEILNITKNLESTSSKILLSSSSLGMLEILLIPYFIPN
jgi:Glu-tRNA(Gln) amidotransferase subunit E-like FAD-binding protein